jgi:hypothetical protein
MTLEFSLTASPANSKAPSSEQVVPQGQKAVAARHHFGFRDLLSDLNPLQYIPVIGTLFRAITGDVIPEPMRDVGSLVVSTVIGGPIGAAINLGELAAEKLTGIDPEKIGDKLLADIGIGGKKAASPTANVHVAKTTPPATKTDAPIAWSPAQLAAYGVTASAGGELEQGSLQGSDVLNGLELDQIRTRQAIAQYNAAKPV